MKSVKSILIATILLCSSVASSVSAQQGAQSASYEFGVSVGDSVMIKRECVEYSTGERPSVWVWDKVHTVRQLGTAKHPDGVLLMNIYSWICDTCLIPVNGKAEESAHQAAIEQKDDREAFEAEQAAKKAAAAKAAQEAADKAAAEKAAAEKAAAEKAAAEEAAKAAEEAAAREAAEQAKQDSIKSQQKFRHNYDRFTIGVRGGASALMHHANQGNWTCGGDVVLDLQYAHYWAKDGRPVDLGLIVGLGIGYQQSGLKKDSDLTTFTKGTVDYTVLAKDVKETDHQLQLEVPLMFSLIHESGLFFNVGPKFMIPVYTPYKQTVNQDGTHISAVFQETGVTVVDEEVTGVYKGQQPEGKNGIQFNINVMLTAELGYEWTLKSGNSLGLGAYANYSVYNTFKNTPNAEGLFNLTAPSDTDKAHLDVLSATRAYADKLGYFDAGVKVAYHFNFPKKMKYKASKL